MNRRMWVPTKRIRRVVAAPVSVYLRDTFTAADGTAITGRALDVDTVGGGWRADSGTYDINTNQCRCATAPLSLALASANAGVSDGTGRFTLVSTGNIGVVGRLLNATNYWLAYVSAATTLQLYEVTAGVFTLRASAAVAAAAGDVLSIVCSGNNIFARLGAVSTPTHVSATHAAETRWGLYVEVANLRLDLFEVVP